MNDKIIRIDDISEHPSLTALEYMRGSDQSSMPLPAYPKRYVWSKDTYDALVSRDTKRAEDRKEFRTDLHEMICTVASRRDEYLELMADPDEDSRGQDLQYRGGISLFPSKEFATLFVSVILLNRHYGGPEEGGWYFDSGSVQEIHMVRVWFWPSGKPEIPDDEFEVVAILEATLNEKYKFDTDNRYSVAGRRDFRLQVTWDMPEDFPSETPTYE
jgi:hypothetical protein